MSQQHLLEDSLQHNTHINTAMLNLSLTTIASLALNNDSIRRHRFVNLYNANIQYNNINIKKNQLKLTAKEKAQIFAKIIAMGIAINCTAIVLPAATAFIALTIQQSAEEALKAILFKLYAATKAQLIGGFAGGALAIFALVAIVYIAREYLEYKRLEKIACETINANYQHADYDERVSTVKNNIHGREPLYLGETGITPHINTGVLGAAAAAAADDDDNGHGHGHGHGQRNSIIN